ncbi:MULTISPECIES: CBO0543 family protein [Paenibacillus]|uniref:CBO0543 family protein n=1 Tax=Paenibacillus TaxID=44249 RepID=UPI0022B91410|nr:CBO0543 family protein [Paenibacillus caseinilyticus]MCZ8517862.1 hypothetical protein [Paenibacillus caseinilyticus]
MEKELSGLGSKQEKIFEKILGEFHEASDHMIWYWVHYSGFNTWQFWLLAAMLICPLIALWFWLDRNRVFLLGFYGYSVHIIFTYLDSIGTSQSFWAYPYKLFPFLPVGFALDVSLVPVCFMFLYQHCLKKRWNYYLLSAAASACFSLIIKPIMGAADLFQMYNGMNYFILFGLYVVVAFGAKWTTNLFIYFDRQSDTYRIRRIK